MYCYNIHVYKEEPLDRSRSRVQSVERHGARTRSRLDTGASGAPERPTPQLAVLRRFAFNPALQRSSALVLGVNTGHVAADDAAMPSTTLTLFSKGAPEKKLLYVFPIQARIAGYTRTNRIFMVFSHTIISF